MAVTIACTRHPALQQPNHPGRATHIPFHPTASSMAHKHTTAQWMWILKLLQANFSNELVRRIVIEIAWIPSLSSSSSSHPIPSVFVPLQILRPNQDDEDELMTSVRQWDLWTRLQSKYFNNTERSPSLCGAMA